MTGERFNSPEGNRPVRPPSEGAAFVHREVDQLWGRNSAARGVGGLASESARGERPDAGFTGFTVTEGGAITNYNPNQRQDRLSSVETINSPNGAQILRRFDGNPRGLVSEITARDGAGNVTVTESFQDGRSIVTERRNDGTERVRKLDPLGRELAPGATGDPDRTENDRTSPQNRVRQNESPGADRRAGRAENGRVQGGSAETAEGERQGRGRRRGRGNHDGHGRERGHGRDREQGHGRGQRRHGNDGQHARRGRHTSDQQRERRQQNDGDGQPRRNERNPRRYQSRLNTQNPNEIYRMKKLSKPVAKPEPSDDTSWA